MPAIERLAYPKFVLASSCPGESWKDVVRVTDVLLQSLKDRYNLVHRRLLKTVEGLTEEQFAWKPTPNSSSIAFNLWHLARWADYLQAAIPKMAPGLEVKLGPGRQIWETQRLAEKWGLDPAQLGWNQTSTQMEDEIAANLALPSSEALLAYLRDAFAAVERAVAAGDDEEARVVYKMPYEKEGRPVGSFIMSFATHDDFHRGQVAALRRAQNLPRAIG